ncbi:MAG TPA: DUF2333 family protein [Candidatus Binatia bacterium]|nr:DUF2333 family protein [Candidatus Binatia bacterium]
MQKALGILGGLVLAALVVVPLVLHFGQRSHDRLPRDAMIPGAEGKPPEAIPPGAAYATAAAEIIEHELQATTGWRPNDIFLWGPGLWADNNSNRQLGILQALRETIRVFKDHLTKVSSDVYDQNLVAADNDLRNDPRKWAFPSAESRYESAARGLRNYAAGLFDVPQTSRPINTRNVELIRLIQSWTDLLGDAHAELYKSQIDWFAIDDAFYRAQGYCHVIAHMIPAVEQEYHRELDSRPVLKTLFGEAEDPLERCARLKPLVVFNGGDTGFIANHRRNMDVYVNEGRQKLYSIREELEK